MNCYMRVVSQVVFSHMGALYLSWAGHCAGAETLTLWPDPERIQPLRQESHRHSILDDTDKTPDSVIQVPDMCDTRKRLLIYMPRMPLWGSHAFLPLRIIRQEHLPLLWGRNQRTWIIGSSFGFTMIFIWICRWRGSRSGSELNWICFCVFLCKIKTIVHGLTFSHMFLLYLCVYVVFQIGICCNCIAEKVRSKTFHNHDMIQKKKLSNLRWQRFPIS